MEGSQAGVAMVAVDYSIGLVGLIAGIVSVVLGVLAIWLSIHFYRQATASESKAAEALAGIRAETSTLAQLTGHQISGLLQIVREQAGASDKSLQTIATAFHGAMTQASGGLLRAPTSPASPQGESIQNHGIPIIKGPLDATTAKETLAGLLLAIYYYAANANFFARGLLPREDDYRENNDLHRHIRQLLDISANDFGIVARLLDEWQKEEPAYLANHRLQAVFGIEGRKLIGLVRTARQQFDELKGAPAEKH